MAQVEADIDATDMHGWKAQWYNLIAGSSSELTVMLEPKGDVSSRIDTL